MTFSSVGRGSKSTKTVWIAPVWMQPYLPLIVNTGGNSVSELMNENADPYINLPLSTLQECVRSQVSFLYRLHKAGMLREKQ
jgi:hypothetical protein